VSSKIRTETVVKSYRVRGCTINITETLWTRGGASYDAATDDGFALHNESFDEIPTLSKVFDLIQNLTEGGDADGMHTEAEVNTFVATLDPRVQIISSRHPDMGTETTIFVDGKKIDAEVIDIDPGAGYETEDYEKRIADAHAAAQTPCATDFDRAVAETLESYRNEFAKWSVDL
jgi:hypothetical protein